MTAAAIRENILYRRMRPGEEHQVFELVKAGFDEFVLPDVMPEGAKEFFRAAREMIFDRPGGHLILVAESQKDIIGMIDIRGDRMQDIAKLINQGGISREEHEKLHDELTKHNSRRQYFFSVTSFMYCGQKI